MLRLGHRGWPSLTPFLLVLSPLLAGNALAVPVPVPPGAPAGPAHGDRAAFLTARAALTLVARPAGSAPAPGWYSNGTGATLFWDKTAGQRTSGLRVAWTNSNLYAQPGTADPYWYAQVAYLNTGNGPVALGCDGDTDTSGQKASMRGTSRAGVVAAEETYCSRHPDGGLTLGPGGIAYDWAIFRGVPPAGGQVSLAWGEFGSSPWVEPWSRGRSDLPPPAACPPELVRLGTCRPGPPPGRTCLFDAPNAARGAGNVGWAFRDGEENKWVFGATEDTREKASVGPGDPNASQSWQEAGTWKRVLEAFYAGEHFGKGIGYYRSYRCVTVGASHPAAAKGRAGVLLRSGYAGDRDNGLTKGVDILRGYGVASLSPASPGGRGASVPAPPNAYYRSALDAAGFEKPLPLRAVPKTAEPL
jgi:hypothetical protein